MCVTRSGWLYSRASGHSSATWRGLIRWFSTGLTASTIERFNDFVNSISGESIVDNIKSMDRRYPEHLRSIR